MSQYRDDRDAARARIEALEAELRDLTAARNAEHFELEAHRLTAFLRSPRWLPLIAVLAVTAIALSGLDLLAHVAGPGSTPPVLVITPSDGLLPIALPPLLPGRPSRN